MDFKSIVVYFWRDASLNEVDLIIETGTHVDAIEIKSSKTINQSFFKGLDYFRKIDTETKLTVIYGGKESQKRTN